MSEYLLEMRGINKEFPGVKALDQVTFAVKPGEIHALVGENGAGKSTLMKVLSGVYPAGTFSGDIVLSGQTQHFHAIHDSEKAGIGIIYQELALVKQLTISENILLGNEIAHNGVINWSASYRKAELALQKVGLNALPSQQVLHLGVGEQQLVEIAKALAKDTRLLILDEPTAALTEGEAANLLKILRDLKQKGVTCIYISHRLKEVFDIADRITVLRDGKTVCTHPTADLTEERLIALMVGRELTQIYPRKPHTPGEVVMTVKNWTVTDPEIDETVVDNASFEVRKGEILGIAGLVGAGRTELVMSLFGVWGHVAAGEVALNGQRLQLKDARDAIQAGISLVSEDRKRYGLVLMADVKTNVSLASLARISKQGVVDVNEEVKFAEKYKADMKIKTPTVEQKVMNLSGGNQQKVVIGKWLMTRPKVLILDEPTRGIDIGAKFEIYNIINDLIDQGVCVMMISSDLPEVLGMSDRILVMHEGKITGELPIAEATQEKVMYYATGGK